LPGGRNLKSLRPSTSTESALPFDPSEITVYPGLLS